MNFTAQVPADDSPRHEGPDKSGEGLAALRQIEDARAAGIPWQQLAEDAGPADPIQLQQARSYLQFRAGLDPDADPETARRGARILRAPADAPLGEKVWGLTAGDADFSDVTASLNEWADQIHGTVQPGRHEAPRGT